MSWDREAFETCLRLSRENARLEGKLEEKDARIRDLQSLVRNSGGCKMTNTPSWHKLPPVPGKYEAKITQGPWDIEFRDDFFTPQEQAYIKYLINANVRQGCCGGCI